MIYPDISLKEALYLHLLQMPNLTGITENDVFQDDRPMDMVDLKNKNRKINIVIEKISENMGIVHQAEEIYNFRLFGVYDNPETDKKMEMLRGILSKEFGGCWGWLAMNKFLLDGSNFVTSTESIDYETGEREIVMRFEFYYRKKLASGLALNSGI